VVLAGLLLAAGCGGGSDPGPAAATEAAAPAPPPALTAVFQPVAAPGELLPIPELRTEAGPGDEVILEAKVMGTMHPFVDGRAAFVVGDEGTLISCDLRHADTCPTPWDNCCDDPKAIRAGTATIQVVDAGGNVLKHGIRGVNGLMELSRLRIAGTVAPQSTPDAFIINATAIDLL
jgi:hypothetical protein